MDEWKVIGQEEENNAVSGMIELGGRVYATDSNGKWYGDDRVEVYIIIY